MARTSRAERHRRRESVLALVSQGKGFSDVVTAQMSQWGCSRSSAQRDCRWAHDQLQLSIDSHDAQHLICHIATSLQRISLKAEESGQFAAAVDAQKMVYELLLGLEMDHEAAKASRPGGGIARATPEDHPPFGSFLLQQTAEGRSSARCSPSHKDFLIAHLVCLWRL